MRQVPLQAFVDFRKNNANLSVGKEPEQSARASAIGSSMSLSFSALEDTDDAHVGEPATKINKMATYQTGIVLLLNIREHPRNNSMVPQRGVIVNALRSFAFGLSSLS